MSKISTAILETLLEEITDYSNVNLTGEEMSELSKACDQWSDKESIESEINIHLKKFGYEYDDEKCEWTRDVLILPISEWSFLDFYFGDLSSSECRQEVGYMINALQEKSEYIVTVKGLFDYCGYFPIGNLDIDEELADELREAFQDEEIQDVYGTIENGKYKGKKYQIVLT